jgi:hypothetical protein
VKNEDLTPSLLFQSALPKIFFHHPHLYSSHGKEYLIKNIMTPFYKKNKKVDTSPAYALGLCRLLINPSPFVQNSFLKPKPTCSKWVSLVKTSSMPNSLIIAKEEKSQKEILGLS